MKKEYLDLAYAFRKSKMWKKIDDNELFAVRLPAKKTSSKHIGYCLIMGRNGEHQALAVYVGEEGFSSYRRIMTGEHRSFADMLTQDCIQCSIEQKEQLSEEELEEIRAYCQETGTPFRPPYPEFSRFAPYCVPHLLRDKGDWQAIGTALETALKMNEVMTASGKAALGLRPIDVSLTGQRYGAEQLGWFLDQQTNEVTIPLYSIEKGVLKTERIPLPPYREIKYREPTRFNDIAIARMKKAPQRGLWSAEVIRVPAPADGDPPYVPAMLMLVDEEGMVRGPVVADGAVYDPNEMVEKMSAALDSDYPACIQVRTEETRVLLSEFCQRSKIRLEVVQESEALDEAISNFLGDLEDSDFDDDDEEGDGPDLDRIIYMLEDLSVEEIRQMPDFLLNQMIELSDILPANIVAKLRKAKKK